VERLKKVWGTYRETPDADRISPRPCKLDRPIPPSRSPIFENQRDSHWRHCATWSALTAALVRNCVAEEKHHASCRRCEVSFVLWMGAVEVSFISSRATPVNRNNREKAATHGSFVWKELYTRDVAASRAFYVATIS
jgi:hypothetical protein